MPSPTLAPALPFSTVPADGLAADKRRATLGWWDGSLMGLKMYRRGRHLLGYGTSPVVIRPDFRTKAPGWDVRDPLSSFPAPQADPDNPCVDDCIFSVKDRKSVV